MIKNGFYNVVGAVIRIGLTLLTIPFIIRLIGVEEYGLWTLVSTMIGIVGLAEAGLSVSTTVFLSRDLANDDADGISQTLTITFGAMLLLATLAALTMWAGAALLVGLFPKLEQAQQVVAVQALQLSGLVVWARLLQQVLVGVEQAYQSYGMINVLNTLQISLSSLGMLVVAWLGGRTLALIAWQAVTSIGFLIAHIWAGCLLVRNLELRPSWDNTKALKVIHYSLMAWLTALGSALFSQCDRLIVGALLGTKVLGVYAVITSVTGQINSLSALAVQPLLPKLSNLLEKQCINQAKLQRQVKQAIQINGLLALGLGGLLFTLAPLVINVMIPGAISNEHILALRIATIIYTLYSLNAVGYYVLFSLKMLNICMIIVLGSGFISLVLLAAGGNVFGLLGAVLGNTGYLGTLFLNLFSLKKLNISQLLWIKYLQFSLIFFFVISVINLLIVKNNILLIIIVAIIQNIMIAFCLLTVPSKLMFKPYEYTGKIKKKIAILLQKPE